MNLLNYVTLPVMTVVCSLSSISNTFAADDLPDWARDLPAHLQKEVRTNIELEKQGNLNIVLQLRQEDGRAAAADRYSAEQATREFLAREEAEQATREFLAREEAERATRDFFAREEAERATRDLFAREARDAAAAAKAAEAATLAFLAQEKREADAANEAATLALLAEEKRVAAAALVAQNAAAQEKKGADAAAEALARNLLAQEKEAAAAIHNPKEEEVRQAGIVLQNKAKIEDYKKEHQKKSPDDVINLQNHDDPKTRAFLAGILAIEMAISDQKAQNIINAIFGELDEEEEKDNG